MPTHTPSQSQGFSGGLSHLRIESNRPLSKPGGVERLSRLLLIKPDCTGTEALNDLMAAVYTRPPFSYPIARRTQFNSSLIASWGSKTEQTQAQSGSEPNQN